MITVESIAFILSEKVRSNYNNQNTGLSAGSRIKTQDKTSYVIKNTELIRRKYKISDHLSAKIFSLNCKKNVILHSL